MTWANKPSGCGTSSAKDEKANSQAVATSLEIVNCSHPIHILPGHSDKTCPRRVYLSRRREHVSIVSPSPVLPPRPLRRGYAGLHIAALYQTSWSFPLYADPSPRLHSDD